MAGFCQVASAGVNCTLPFTFINGTLADANQVNANNAALVACLLNAAGAGNNNDITALLALTTPISSAAGGSTVYVGGVSTGTANAQTVPAPVPTGFALTRGNSVIFVASATNTGPTTLATAATAATNVFRATPSGPQALTGGEIIANNIVWAVYDGTQYQIVSNGPQFGGFGPLLGLSSATPDLGTVPTHNVNITGNTTITSFGSTASATYPVYNLTFSGALVLTHNGTSLILPSATNITTAANDTATALYLGGGNWQVMDYRRATGTSVVSPTPLCGFSGLSGANGASTSTATWSWNSSVLINPVGNIPVFSTAKNTITVNITTVGAGGMDVAGLGANTFVYMYAIYNGSVWNAVGTANAPPTGPTPMPGGYTHLCYMGAMKTNAGTQLYGTLISGADAVYVVGGANLATSLPTIDSGTPKGSNCNAAGTTYVTETVRGSAGAGVWMPATATIGRFVASLASSTTALASNLTYVGTIAAGGQAFQASATPGSTTIPILMESNAVFWCNTAAAAALFQLGWHDQVNAN